tara:strand:+ start:5677 stop:5850 length:174 start_codon:yes stop_codon:yes gene_type:complete
VIVVEAAFVLACALYFIQVSVLMLMERGDGKLRLFRVFMTLMQASFLEHFALSALAI